ncbi:hypothetical protein JW859_10365 [bacterium]|nr:hypothetical protein [bacterium]
MLTFASPLWRTPAARIALLVLLVFACLLCGAGAAQAQESDLTAEEYLGLYAPPVDIYTTDWVESYECYRYSDDALAVEIFVPDSSQLDDVEGFFAMDLAAMIGHISEIDPGFTALAEELAGWEAPADSTDTASMQLALIHAICDSEEYENMPAATVLGDSTSLLGFDYEFVIYHPYNVPLVCALIYTEDADPLGIALLMAGSLILTQ